MTLSFANPCNSNEKSIITIKWEKPTGGVQESTKKIILPSLSFYPVLAASNPYRSLRPQSVFAHPFPSAVSYPPLMNGCFAQHDKPPRLPPPCHNIDTPSLFILRFDKHLGHRNIRVLKITMAQSLKICVEGKVAVSLQEKKTKKKKKKSGILTRVYVGGLQGALLPLSPALFIDKLKCIGHLTPPYRYWRWQRRRVTIFTCLC